MNGSKSDQLNNRRLDFESPWIKEMLLKALCCLLIFSSLISCKNGKEENRLTIFAAASLGDVLKDLGEEFEIKNGIELRFNFGSSGTLARQIREGALADMYISANEKWADYLAQEGMFGGEAIEKLAQNRLVMIGSQNVDWENFNLDSSLNLGVLQAGQRMAMGDPRHVPAGQYARQALEHFDLYKEIEPHILPGKDVRSALMMVELEEAPLGIVYRTDALRSKKVQILYLFPPDSHAGIYYYAGICREGSGVKDFLSFLVSEEAKSIWERYGFE